MLFLMLLSSLILVVVISHSTGNITDWPLTSLGHSGPLLESYGTDSMLVLKYASRSSNAIGFRCSAMVLKFPNPSVLVRNLNFSYGLRLGLPSG